MNRNLEILCELGAVSGFEDEVRDYILERAMPFAQEIVTDRMGNLLVFKKGRATPESKLMLCAHMDEVGLIITGITDDGCARFDCVGGIDRRILTGKRVFIGKNRIPGIIGVKAWHHVKSSQRNDVPEIEALYIDVGAKDELSAMSLISLGDPVVFEGGVTEFGEGFVKAKAIDDRLGCALMLELLESDLPCDTWFAFTVQEELGTRGASAAAFGLAPDIALVLEATTAADIPGVPEGKRVCRLGRGAVIPFMDKSTVYDRRIYRALTTLADKNNIRWQTKQMIAGGTDSAAIQRSRDGVRTAVVAAPVRNIHTPSCVAKLSDIESVMSLLQAFLENMVDGDSII